MPLGKQVAPFLHGHTEAWVVVVDDADEVVEVAGFTVVLRVLVKVKVEVVEVVVGVEVEEVVVAVVVVAVVVVVVVVVVVIVVVVVVVVEVVVVIWQLTPENPDAQVHEYTQPFWDVVHVAPFKQGLLEHASVTKYIH